MVTGQPLTPRARLFPQGHLRQLGLLRVAIHINKNNGKGNTRFAFAIWICYVQRVCVHEVLPICRHLRPAMAATFYATSLGLMVNCTLAQVSKRLHYQD